MAFFMEEMSVRDMRIAMEKTISVYGAGLAGCEAAWQLAKRHIHTELYEMKPIKFSPAHHSSDFAELVCSNSLRGDTPLTMRQHPVRCPQARPSSSVAEYQRRAGC